MTSANFSNITVIYVKIYYSVLIGSVVHINDTEKQLMRLVKQNQLSVGELVKCVECGIVDVSMNDMRKLAGNYVTAGPFAWKFVFVELAVFQGRRTGARRVGYFY